MKLTFNSHLPFGLLPFVLAVILGLGPVQNTEAGLATDHDASGTKPHDDKVKCDVNTPMAHYNFHTQVVSLNIMDTPVGYTPPLGPDMHFTVTYNQREVNPPNAHLPLPGFGPKWVCNWISYLDDISYDARSTTVRIPGGGSEFYRFNSDGTPERPDLQSGASVTKVLDSLGNILSYVRRTSDGSQQVYGRTTDTFGARRWYMTKLIDPTGQEANFDYDPVTFRLMSVSDPINPPFTIEYWSDVPTELPLYYLIKSVKDFALRTATFEYNSGGRLWKIHDAIGITSEFRYNESGQYENDFITTMVTPYGETQFSQPTSLPPAEGARTLQAIEPDGGIERLEYQQGSGTGIDPDDDNQPVDDANPPATWVNHLFHARNSFYWDKKAMAMYPPDANGIPNFGKAKITHWLHLRCAGDNVISNIKEREKMPLENPIYYRYPGQGGCDVGANAPVFTGDQGAPSIVARRLGNGSGPQFNQFFRYEYDNPFQKVTKVTDPEGRVTHYQYAPNHIDLIGVFQKNPAGWEQYPGNEHADKLFEISYNDSHQPLSIRGPLGLPISYTYTKLKQLETVTNVRSETTTYGYGDDSPGHPIGYVTSITSPQVNGVSASTEFYYDSAHRVQKITTQPDGYEIIFEYDDLDRQTRITYPDNTTEEFKYTRHNDQNVDTGVMTLDLTASKDRLGHWTYRHYNSNRQMTSIVDDLTQTSYDWCSCGSLDRITDPNGNMTVFNRDLQGRVHQKVFQDTRAINYLYEGQSAPNTPGATSRLKSATDALNRSTNYTYFRDNNLKQTSYSDATPTVSYTYDSYHNRIATMVDGTGETVYTFNQIGDPLWGNDGTLHSIAGPLADDTITFIHDELGRTISQTIEGGDESTAVYDSLGRLTTTVNALGEFGRTYYGPTSRLDTLTYPTGQTTHYIYYGNSKDLRLQTLQNRDPQTLNLSKFDYDYDAEGQISSWARQLGTASSGRWFVHDEIRRLLSSRNHSNPNSATEVDTYGYDDAGNRTSDAKFTSQIPFGGISHSYTPNNLNQIESFTMNQGPISGEDVYLTHDLAGNLIDNGEGKTFEWDAANRLKAINHGSQRSEFTYDGLSRRVKIVEKTGSTVTSTKHFVWVGNTIAQERDGDNKVTRQYFAEGEQQEKSRYYTRDHLGSIREMTDGAGTLMARYDYDPYGQRTKLAGAEDVDFGYTGHYHHAPSGLNLTLYRAYDPAVGRWLSRDPIGEAGGINLYGYVDNAPVNNSDEFGLYVNIVGNTAYRVSVREHLRFMMNADPTLRQMVRDLYASDNQHVITMPTSPGGYNDTSPTNKAKSENGEGSGSNCQFDPNNWVAPGGQVRDPVIALVHELMHSFQINFGTIMPSLNPNSGISRAEEWAVRRENIMRQYLGVPLRLDFDGKPVQNPGPR